MKRRNVNWRNVAMTKFSNSKTKQHQRRIVKRRKDETSQGRNVARTKRRKDETSQGRNVARTKRRKDETSRCQMCSPDRKRTATSSWWTSRHRSWPTWRPWPCKEPGGACRRSRSSRCLAPSTPRRSRCTPWTHPLGCKVPERRRRKFYFEFWLSFLCFGKIVWRKLRILFTK